MEDSRDFMISEALERVDGDIEMLGELMSMLSEEVSVRLGEMREAVAGGNALALEHAAHSLKSAFGNLGATTASELCLELEKRGRSKDVSDASPFLDQLEEAYRRFEGLSTQFFNEQDG